MPLARINNRLLHFVHIPKTGGASVTDYMRKKGVVALYSREQLAWAQSTPQHLEFDISRVLIPDGFADMSFAIIRDPLERLLSEYRYRATRYHDQGTVFERLAKSKKMKVELDWDEEFEGTFDEWLDLVFFRYTKQPNTCDNHIRPQIDFIGPNMKIFLFERGLQAVYRWIDAVTDTKSLLVPLDQNKSRKFDIEISSEAKDRVINFYKRDYSLITALRSALGDNHETGSIANLSGINTSVRSGRTA